MRSPWLTARTSRSAASRSPPTANGSETWASCGRRWRSASASSAKLRASTWATGSLTPSEAAKRRASPASAARYNQAAMAVMTSAPPYSASDPASQE